MASNETKYRVNMDRDWGIDLSGRKMRYSPYHADREKNYIEPNESEIADIYEISGEAISETLLYFEECGGKTDKLIDLLNSHMPDNRYFVSREILLDKKRWWNNEFYFYFIIFCKKLIGRYDWRFGENSDKQVSVYHRMYEKGFIEKTPWGEDDYGNKVTDANIVSSLSAFVIMEDILYLESDDYLSWLNALIPTKYKLDRNMFNMESILISFEFFYYTVELSKIIINNISIYTPNHYYKVFEKIKIIKLFANMPKKDAFKSILEMNTTTSTIFNYSNTLKKGYFKTHIATNKNCDYAFFGIYKNTLSKMHSSIFASTFAGFIYIFFDELPTPKISYRFTNTDFFFDIELFWKKSQKNLFLKIGSVFSIAVIYLILSYLFYDKKYFLPAVIDTVLISGLSFTILTLFDSLKELKKKYNKLTTLSKEQYGELEAIARRLVDKKMNLEKAVSERTKSLELANEELKKFDYYKTMFFTNISHEFRTPLSLILSPVECIKKGDYGNKIDKNNKVFSTIENNAKRLLKLTNDILEWSRFQLGKTTVNLKTIPLNKVLSLYVTYFESRAKNKNLSLELNNSSEDLYIDIDTDLFESIISNLIDNSLKYTENGGITVSVSTRNNNAVIKIIDTGIGIPKNDIENLFNPFYRVSSNPHKYSGFGLGLTIVKEKAELMNGKILCESEIDKGTVFSLIFPISKITNEEIALSNNIFNNTENLASSNKNDKILKQKYFSSDNLLLKNKKILVVEDNFDLLNHLNSILSSRYNVITVTDGEEALNLLKNETIPPDLIISDVMMANVDGITLLNTIKKETIFSYIPFIFLTAINDPEEKINSLKNGAIDYILKPFNIDELYSKIDSILSLMDFYKNNIVAKILGNINEIDKKEDKNDNYDILLYSLTKREIELVNYFSKGFEFKEIGEELGISINTIKNHFQNIYKKLNVNNKIELFNLIQTGR